MYESIQPIVLVGGASRRFGRDKLREPVGQGWLVDRPIAALREVFGSRVAAVGNCDPAIAARADRHLLDRHPGRGPLGGIIAAIEAFESDVFVLAGDVPSITAALVRSLLAAAGANPDALAVWARSDSPEPCIGLYRRIALDGMRSRFAVSGSLIAAIAPGHIVLVPAPRAEMANANTPDALIAADPRGQLRAS